MSSDIPLNVQQLNDQNLLYSSSFPLSYHRSFDHSAFSDVEYAEISISRGRCNFSPLESECFPSGGLAVIQFRDNLSIDKCNYLLSQIDILLSSNFSLIQSQFYIHFPKQIKLFSPEERIGIDMMYSLLRYTSFNSLTNKQEFSQLFENDILFDADYFSVFFKLTNNTATVKISTIYNKQILTFPYQIIPHPSFTPNPLQMKHFLLPIDWFLVSYNLELNYFESSSVILITGIIPNYAHLNFVNSIVTVDGVNNSITKYCQFSRTTSLQYKCNFINSNQISLYFELNLKMKPCEQYPYDANRGIDFLTPIIQVNEGKEYYLNHLLLALPQPDFSMPYNVMLISFSFAIIFLLALYKLLTKDPFSAGLLVEKLTQLKQKYPNLLSKLKIKRE